MLMASKCRSFFVISVYLKSRNFYFVTSFFDTDSVRLTTAFGSDHPVVSRISYIHVCIYEGKNYRMFCMMYNSLAREVVVKSSRS